MDAEPVTDRHRHDLRRGVRAPGQALDDLPWRHRQVHRVRPRDDELVDAVADDEVLESHGVREEADLGELRLDLLDRLAFVDRQAHLAGLGGRRPIHPVGELGGEEVGHDRQTDDARVVLEQAGDGRADHGSREEPAAGAEHDDREERRRPRHAARRHAGCGGVSGGFSQPSTIPTRFGSPGGGGLPRARPRSMVTWPPAPSRRARPGRSRRPPHDRPERATPRARAERVARRWRREAARPSGSPRPRW